MLTGLAASLPVLAAQHRLVAYALLFLGAAAEGDLVLLSFVALAHAGELSLPVVIALGGTAYAAATINGATIVDHTIAGRKLINNTLTGTQINDNVSDAGTILPVARAEVDPEDIAFDVLRDRIGRMRARPFKLA